jgi:NAD(P)-dependent dehydrogenase (short-subunit alcohol dehydrogenase family)
VIVGTVISAARDILSGTKEPLHGRTVFVTGAARGLGAEVARQAHAAGAQVALVGRRLPPLEELATELGSRAIALEADVTDPAALERAAQATADAFGGIDLVVANAGIAPPSDTIRTIDPAAFERTIEVNLLGQWRSIRATLPHIVETQGHILVVASIYAFMNGALNASYAASKAGVEQLVRALRVELAPTGATAGVAYLGFIETDLAAEVFAQDQVAQARDALPAFITRPIEVRDAAKALINGLERRTARVRAPRWVAPMLSLRGALTNVMDEVLIRNRALAGAIMQAEQNRR